jgi:hypothetical protein
LFIFFYMLGLPLVLLGLYWLFLGAGVVADGTVALRSRSGGDQGVRSIHEFVTAARDEIARRGR